MIEVVYMTAEAVLLSGVIWSKDGGERRIITKKAGFRGHNELFSAIIFDKIHSERY